MKLDREKFLAAAFVMVGASSTLVGCSKKEPTADTQATTAPAAETTATTPKPPPPPAPNAEAVVKPGDRVVRVPAPHAETAAPATPPPGAPPKIKPVTK
ncbi:MAG: hypothetical protein IT374_19870 [Polyangiaceae bacterium]|nr:hypothetical protein [Polyangiaceae bacterium]